MLQTEKQARGSQADYPVSHDAGTRLSFGVQPSPSPVRQTAPPKILPTGRINTEAIKVDFQLQPFLSYIRSHSWAQITWISELAGVERTREHCCWWGL